MKHSNQYNYCNVEGDTNKGCKRAANEDWYAHFECNNGLVSVVCDGMGGHVGGSVASHLAVETIQTFLENNYFDDPRKAIIEACNTANSAILQRTSQRPELTGMGSTCVMLIVRNGKVFIGSVGDSRVYLIRSKTIIQLTKDQSYVQMLVDEGAITKDQAEHHPRKNEITNALGLPSMQPATVLPDPLNPEAGDCFLLCSDGLSGMVSDHEIMKVVSNQTSMTQKERVAELIRRACNNGGLDNITSLIVEFSVTPNSGTDESTQHRILFRCILPCLVVAMLLGIGGHALWKHYHKQPTEQEASDSTSITSNKQILISCKKTICFAKNAQKIEVELHSDLGGAYIMLVNTKGDKTRIKTVKCGNITTSDIEIDPSENFSRNVHNGHIQFIYNNEPFTDDSITVKFRNGDTVYLCRVAVEQPVQSDIDENQNKVNDSHGPASETKPKGGIKEIYNGISKSTESKDPEEVTTGDVKVGREGETKVTVYSKKGTATNTELYSSYGFKTGDATTNWYTYSCGNGNICNITIYNAKVPNKDATISIPLVNAGDKKYIIKVTH